MRIGEVADITGLSISNIRFYEKKGLIAPDRQVESKYRTYTEEDVCRLKTIMLYRKMDLPIETIQDIINNDSVVLEDALKAHINDLKEKKEILQNSIMLCEKMLGEDEIFEIDVDYYLNYTKEEEKTGAKYPKLEEMLDDVAQMFTQDMYPFMIPFIYSTKWRKLRHVLTFMVLLVWMLCPVVMVVEELIKNGAVTGLKLFAAITWYSVFLMYIVQYRHAKAKSG